MSDSENDVQINFGKSLIIWMIISVIIAVIFARNSQGMCEYLFFSFAYLFIIYIITKVWKKFEFNPSEQALIIAASLGGWFLGTFIVWRGRNGNKFFTETCYEN